MAVRASAANAFHPVKKKKSEHTVGDLKSVHGTMVGYRYKVLEALFC
jgi:hypothetical protein